MEQQQKHNEFVSRTVRPCADQEAVLTLLTPDNGLVSPGFELEIKEACNPCSLVPGSFHLTSCFMRFISAMGMAIIYSLWKNLIEGRHGLK